jgi:MYND finger
MHVFVLSFLLCYITNDSITCFLPFFHLFVQTYQDSLHGVGDFTYQGKSASSNFEDENDGFTEASSSRRSRGASSVASAIATYAGGNNDSGTNSASSTPVFRGVSGSSNLQSGNNPASFSGRMNGIGRGGYNSGVAMTGRVGSGPNDTSSNTTQNGGYSSADNASNGVSSAQGTSGSQAYGKSGSPIISSFAAAAAAGAGRGSASPGSGVINIPIGALNKNAKAPSSGGSTPRKTSGTFAHAVSQSDIITEDGKWICPRCTLENDSSNNHCEACREQAPAAVGEAGWTLATSGPSPTNKAAAAAGVHGSQYTDYSYQRKTGPSNAVSPAKHASTFNASVGSRSPQNASVSRPIKVSVGAPVGALGASLQPIKTSNQPSTPSTSVPSATVSYASIASGSAASGTAQQQTSQQQNAQPVNVQSSNIPQQNKQQLQSQQTAREEASAKNVYDDSSFPSLGGAQENSNINASTSQSDETIIPSNRSPTSSPISSTQVNVVSIPTDANSTSDDTTFSLSSSIKNTGLSTSAPLFDSNISSEEGKQSNPVSPLIIQQSDFSTSQPMQTSSPPLLSLLGRVPTDSSSFQQSLSLNNNGNLNLLPLNSSSFQSQNGPVTSFSSLSTSQSLSNGMQSLQLQGQQVATLQTQGIPSSVAQQGLQNTQSMMSQMSQLLQLGQSQNWSGNPNVQGNTNHFMNLLNNPQQQLQQQQLQQQQLQQQQLQQQQLQQQQLQQQQLQQQQLQQQNVSAQSVISRGSVAPPPGFATSMPQHQVGQLPQTGSSLPSNQLSMQHQVSNNTSMMQLGGSGSLNPGLQNFGNVSSTNVRSGTNNNLAQQLFLNQIGQVSNQQPLQSPSQVNFSPQNFGPRLTPSIVEPLGPIRSPTANTILPDSGFIPNNFLGGVNVNVSNNNIPRTVIPNNLNNNMGIGLGLSGSMVGNSSNTGGRIGTLGIPSLPNNMNAGTGDIGLRRSQSAPEPAVNLQMLKQQQVHLSQQLQMQQQFQNLANASAFHPSASDAIASTSPVNPSTLAALLASMNGFRPDGNNVLEAALAAHANMSTSGSQNVSTSANESTVTQPPRLPGVKNPCQVCGKEGLLDCQQCANEPPYVRTYYCSPQHQASDFKTHQRIHEANRTRHNYTGHPPS